MSNVIVPLAALGIPLLGVAGLYCLFFGKSMEHYRHLVRTAAVFLGAAALLMGGNLLLGCFGLAWRTVPSHVLFGVMLVSGWIGLIFTMACLLPMEWPSMGAALRRTIKGVLLFLAVLILLIALWVGMILLVFAGIGQERVVEHQGQTLLEVDDGFMDPHLSYYVYHGPLIRGTERIYDDYEPLHDK